MLKKEAAKQTAVQTNGTKKNVLVQYWRCRYLFLLFLPVTIYFVIFHYIPMYGVQIAFKDFFPAMGIWGSKWVGLKHFDKLFHGMYFWPALRNTLIISFGKLIFGFPAPIILSLMLNEVRHSTYKKTVQTVTYLPHFISWVVLASIVTEVLSPSRGVVNYVLQALGMDPIFFVGSKQWFRPVIIGSAMWRDTGWQTVVFLAAITGIDTQLYEAAEVDGAGRFQRILHITLPGIIPTIVIMFIFAVGGIIADDFDQIYNLLNAQVMEVGEVIGTYTYRVGIQQMDYSYATAVGLFRNVVALLLVTITNGVSRKLSGNSLW